MPATQSQIFYHCAWEIGSFAAVAAGALNTSFTATTTTVQHPTQLLINLSTWISPETVVLSGASSKTEHPAPVPVPRVRVAKAQPQIQPLKVAACPLQPQSSREIAGSPAQPQRPMQPGSPVPPENPVYPVHPEQPEHPGCPVQLRNHENPVYSEPELNLPLPQLSEETAQHPAEQSESSESPAQPQPVLQETAGQLQRPVCPEPNPVGPTEPEPELKGPKLPESKGLSFQCRSPAKPPQVSHHLL
ncbi:mediator of DNA damage checkpoint protein 1-like [Archocentrus centrarchus]|uniref:mediator of DNA damage checkpoint protein 1-like n=1 Tax=Archocentrus centrarchus TaxID=63155 RepID=UPI0011EA0348|nr:mediator of DNA damage checkpoint protein 1-like [Archocentrus centrarchus]